jgi:hypothetical protein
LDLPLVFKEQKALQHHYLYLLRGFQVVPGKISGNPYYQLKGGAHQIFQLNPFSCVHLSYRSLRYCREKQTSKINYQQV